MWVACFGHQVSKQTVFHPASHAYIKSAHPPIACKQQHPQHTRRYIRYLPPFNMFHCPVLLRGCVAGGAKSPVISDDDWNLWSCCQIVISCWQCNHWVWGEATTITKPQYHYYVLFTKHHHQGTYNTFVLYFLINYFDFNLVWAVSRVWAKDTYGKDVPGERVQHPKHSFNQTTTGPSESAIPTGKGWLGWIILLLSGISLLNCVGLRTGRD